MIYKIACMSDVHLGHSSSDLNVSLLAIDQWLLENDVFNKDLLIISGDLFDKGLSFTQRGMGDLLNWWFKFSFKATEAGLTVRILEGTELHDRKQAKTLVQAVSIPKFAAFNCKYIYDLEVEKLYDDDLSILYLRDNYPGSPDDITNLCQTAILNAGLDKVHIAVMHGNFSYHLPSVAKAPYYDEIKFLAMVSGFIIIGHNHEFSLMYERIITPGSFDANTHADVDDKGGVCIDYNSSTKEFILERAINKLQRRFITLENMSVKDIKNKLKEIKLLNTIIHIRIIVETIEIKELLFTYISQNYANIKLNILVKKDTPVFNSLPLLNSVKVFNLKESLDNIIDEFSKREKDIAIDILAKVGNYE